MNTTQVLNEILDRLADLDNNADYYNLDDRDIQDVRTSIVSMSELLDWPDSLTGDACTDIGHHLFFGGLDSYPRDRLLNWTKELTQ